VARLYSNENFPLPVVEHLRELGHDVLTTQESGRAGCAVPDENVLKFASDQGRAVLTFNRRHFLRLHDSINHAGIIVCTFDPDFYALATRIHESVAPYASLLRRLIRINRPQTNVPRP
jgi:hypothetical protein